MKKNLTFTKLLRISVAMLLVMALLLCGCGKKEEETTPTPEAENKGITLGDGDGKLEAQDFVDGFTTIYGAMLSGKNANTNSANFGTETKMSIKLGKNVKSMLGMAMSGAGMDADLSWLKDISLKMTSKMDDGLMQMLMSLNLNGQDIIGMDAVIDMANMIYYMGITELSNKYIKMDMSTMMGGMAPYDVDSAPVAGGVDVMDLLEKLGEVADQLPSEEALNALLTKYLDVAIKALGNPVVTTETLSHGGVSQTVTATTYQVRASNMLNMSKQILLTAQNDKDLEAMLDTLAGAVEELSGQQMDLHAELVAMLPEMLEEIDEQLADLDAEMNQFGFDFVAYTAGEEQVGFKVVTIMGLWCEKYNPVTDSYETTCEREETTVYFYNLRSGDKTAFVLDVDDASFRVEGTGTVSGDKTNGTYTLLTNGNEKILDIQLKDFNANAGTGVIRLIPAEELLERAMGLTTIIAEPVLEVKMSKDGLSLNILDGEELFIGLEFTTKALSNTSVKIPSNVVNMDQAGLNSWMMSMDIENILDNLEKAGVPDELLDMITGGMGLG